MDARAPLVPSVTLAAIGPVQDVRPRPEDVAPRPANPARHRRRIPRAVSRAWEPARPAPDHVPVRHLSTRPVGSRACSHVSSAIIGFLNSLPGHGRPSGPAFLAKEAVGAPWHDSIRLACLRPPRHEVAPVRTFHATVVRFASIGGAVRRHMLTPDSPLPVHFTKPRHPAPCTKRTPTAPGPGAARAPGRPDRCAPATPGTSVGGPLARQLADRRSRTARQRSASRPYASAARSLSPARSAARPSATSAADRSPASRAAGTACTSPP